MQRTITKSGVEAYVRANWFKIIMISLIAFVFLRKDLSFSFNLNSPLEGQDQEHVPLKEEVHQNKLETKPKPSAKMTDVAKAGSNNNTTSLFDMIDIPFIGKGKVVKVAEPEIRGIDEAAKQAYINRFANVAINERKKYGIPSSIILANALLHSFAGQRDMSINGNNHFALPCVVGWKGGSGTYNDACYRHYENAWTSFRDHSLYVTTGPNQKLPALGKKDYKAWAKGLEKSKSFDIDNLAATLISIIEAFDWTKYD